MTTGSASLDHGIPRFWRGVGGIRADRWARVFGLLLFLLVGGQSLLPGAEAQDRSVPRFGPLVAPDTVQAGPLDFGRVWSFAQPPLDYFEEQYRVSANERGLRHARLGTVRLPGCSGALVSPKGLVLTAARCVRTDAGAEASSFYAAQQEEERELDGMSAERVVEIRGVTAQVDSLTAEGGSADGDTSLAWTAAVEQVQRRLQSAAPDEHSVEVVREAGGTRYVAYHYRRYEDVRLVFLPDPEVRVGAQMSDLLSYPQYTWDVAALRIYDGGTPLAAEEHFGLRTQGARPGDAVFAVGYPEDTRRAETHHQLAFQRDVETPDQVARLEAWTAHLQQFVDTAEVSSQWARRLRDDHSPLKRTRAQFESLRNGYLTARLRRQDDALRQGGEAARASQLMEELRTLQEEKRTHADAYRAFSAWLHPAYSSATLRRAVRAAQAMNDDLPASSDPDLEGVPAQPPSLDAALLADHLQRMRMHLDADSALASTLEQFEADEIVQTSVLSTPNSAQTALRNRAIPDDDPALALMEAVYDRYAAFRSSWKTLQVRERRLTDSLAQIRHQRLERPVALPQSRSLRIADGRIQGYPYNGTIAPPFTTFFGLYGRHAASDGGSSLPERWRTASTAVDRSTPLTTVSSTDLGGYGGPLLNASLQVVGIVVDGNVQSAAGDFLFLPRRMRAVSVDVRGVLEGLSSVYGAESLVQEMTKDAVPAQ